jgi:hypothetical protein
MQSPSHHLNDRVVVQRTASAGPGNQLLELGISVRQCKFLPMKDRVGYHAVPRFLGDGSSRTEQLGWTLGRLPILRVNAVSSGHSKMSNAAIPRLFCVPSVVYRGNLDSRVDGPFSELQYQIISTLAEHRHPPELDLCNIVTAEHDISSRHTIIYYSSLDFS